MSALVLALVLVFAVALLLLPLLGSFAVVARSGTRRIAGSLWVAELVDRRQ